MLPGVRTFPRSYVPRKSYRVSVPPAVEPVTVTQVRDELGLDSNPPSGVLERMIKGARELAEAYTGRAFITQTIEQQMDTFPGASMPWWDGVRQGARSALSPDAPIELYAPPVQAVTGITYTDQANAEHTVDPTTYYLDEIVEPARVLLLEGASWPVDPRVRAAVTITYTAGYGDAATDLPSAIAEAILAHVRDLLERPNVAISSETIDNASTVYGSQRTGAAAASGANAAGGLRGDAAAILAHLRIMPVV